MPAKKSTAAAPKKQEAVTKEKAHNHLELEKEIESLKKEVDSLKGQCHSCCADLGQLKSELSKLIDLSKKLEKTPEKDFVNLVLINDNYNSLRKYLKKLK